jgi:transcription elongation factor S-II
MESIQTQPKYNTVKESVAANPDKFRQNIALKIQVLLEEGNEDDYENDAINIEKGVFNYTIKESNTKKIIKKWDNAAFLQLYMDRLRTVYINMKNIPGLLTKIQKKEIAAQQVAFMTHQEMRPEKWKELIDANIKRDKQKVENNIEAATDTFTCRKCHKNQCTYYQMQTRSADEPMTTFVQCIPCGNRWKC